MNSQSTSSPSTLYCGQEPPCLVRKPPHTSTHLLIETKVGCLCLSATLIPSPWHGHGGLSKLAQPGFLTTLPFHHMSQDLEDLEEAEEPDLEEDDDQKAVKDEL